VKQLTNSELLDLVKKSKKDSTTTPNTQNEAGDPEEQADDAQSQDLSSSPFCLPQSPLIDLRLVAARSRHRVEKPLPSKDKSLFQLKLQKNPYGKFPSFETE